MCWRHCCLLQGLTPIEAYSTRLPSKHTTPPHHHNWSLLRWGGAVAGIAVRLSASSSVHAGTWCAQSGAVQLLQPLPHRLRSHLQHSRLQDAVGGVCNRRQAVAQLNRRQGGSTGHAGVGCSETVAKQRKGCVQGTWATASLLGCRSRSSIRAAVGLSSTPENGPKPVTTKRTRGPSACGGRSGDDGGGTSASRPPADLPRC